MIRLTPSISLPSTVQFDSVSVGDAIIASSITLTSNVRAVGASFASIVCASIIGGTAASGNLTLFSTNHATKGKILFGNSVYDEATNRLGIGITAPRRQVEIYADSPEFILTDFGQAADAKVWRLYNAATLLKIGTVDDAFSSGTDFFTITRTGVISLPYSSSYLDLSAISAGSPNLKITATTDTPSTVFATAAGSPQFNQLPDGYMELNKGGSAVYIPFWR